MIKDIFKLSLTPQKEDCTIIYAIKALLQRYEMDNLSQIGGQLAYFSMLSIFPFLIFINAVIAKLHLPISKKFLETKEILPPEIIEIINNYLGYLGENTNPSILSLGLLFSIYLASRSSLSLIEAINKAYRTDIHAPIWQKIIVSLIITITLGVTLILSLIFLTLGETLTTDILTFFHLPIDYSRIWNLIRWSFVILALSGSLSMVYYILPCKKTSFKLVIPGTIFAMVGFLGMTMLFSMYVNRYNNYTAIYGSLGGIIIFMIWLYTSGIVIVLGAELNHILETKHLGIYSYDILEKQPTIDIKQNKKFPYGVSGRPQHHNIKIPHQNIPTTKIPRKKRATKR